MVSSYRPHNPGHDYYSPGIYLITLVVTGRERLLSSLNMDARQPDVALTALGTAVMACWQQIPAIQQQKGRHLRLHAAVCMPDHFHGVIEVMERMDVNLGEVIRGFKAGCTMAWRQLQHPSMAAEASGGGSCQPYLDDMCRHDDNEWIKHLSKRQRREYYDRLIAEGHRTEAPLFDDNYDDTICIDERHKAAMINYVHDNPRRAIIRRIRPQFMERRLHIKLAIPDKDGKAMVDDNGRIITRDYAAFGNLFLLRWARKVQVFCHRKAPDGRTPYEKTEAYREECHMWKRMVMEGQTVIVTPGISMGERIIKDRCIESGYPLIHLQKEPISPYWKPERSRFDACCRGSLLILAPWGADELGDVRGVPSNTDYSIFHNLNGLAEEICLFEGDAKIVGG